MTEERDLFRAVASLLIEQHGWDRAVQIATAVRGHVYSQPNAGPYRDDAEGIYNRLGWEQAALLAAWFRDSRNWPKKRPSGP
ncbi:hypothetical protein [Streptomyces mirabilis]|uniref:hypothetical protein n=1 Tax=Streptomyces mirabilis TaxID=68239 RepID=UPI0036B0EFAF